MAQVQLARNHSRTCHPAFAAALFPLFISHSVEPRSDLPAEDRPAGGAGVSADAPVLDAYAGFWTRSLFTTHSHEAPMPVASMESPGWAADFELSGWTRVDGALTVYLTRRSSGTTLTLQESEPETPDTPQLVTLAGEDTILDGKVQIRMNGASAWIALNTAASANVAPVKKPLDAFRAPAQVQDGEEPLPPTTIDSRAARLNGPVLLDASATYESILARPQEPAPTAVERLRERREKLIRDFPRRPQP
ncbi:hypothetical protein [Prosthecobacter sp.]|jgi:hypothetical protein|uniref:hypothetical protein n=1 Tax=Prosthecobacter sp. TaxID=1965333 RepID=UPI0037832505